MTEIKHKIKFGSQSHANKFLAVAEAFINDHPEVVYWTEANDTKKGLFYRYKDGVYKACSTFEIDNLLLDYTPTDHSLILPRAASEAKQQEILRNVKKLKFVYRDVFNPVNIVNFKNGFFDVNTGMLSPHNMGIISTIQLPYNYNPEAECPLFMKVLNESLSGDVEKIGIIQEFVGYCLIPSTKFMKALFFVGASQSGKSTVLDSIEATLGKENCSAIRMDMICDSRFIGHLIDKYVNIDREVPHEMSNYEEALKKVISGEKITVNTKFLPSYDTNLTCKLMFAANDLPKINDTSDAIFERILLLDFNNVVAKDKRDADLKDKISKNECAGIFNWAYEGLKRLLKNGKFTSSNDMISHIEELKLLNNSVYYFISETHEVTENDEHYVVIDDLYESYKDFCHEVGAKGIFKKPTFGKEMRKVFVNKIKDGRKTIKGKQTRIYTGIRKKDDISQYSPAELSEGITWAD